MKLFKSTILSLVLSLIFLSSCTDNEPVFDNNPDVQTKESQSVTRTMNEFSKNFNQDGSLNSQENPNGSILFDFCFEFVYPLNLSYNNGTTVTVNNLEDLIDVLINSSDALFINGIAFPFDVVQFNEDTNSIETITINTEEEFASLVNNCGFDEDPCECTEEYNPVCVEITTPNGESVIITFANACFAECEGFTQNDFLDNCDGDDYNGPIDDECFSFNFPISIINDQGVTVTVNNQNELDIELYTSYGFEFVYPFDVTLESDGSIITINTHEDFSSILDNCYDDGGNYCDCTTESNPVCVEMPNPNGGGTVIVTFLNACIAECNGYTQNDFVDCENDGGSAITDCITFVYPLDIIDSQGVTTTVNSDEELNSLYNPNSSEFVFPFDILEDGATITVNTPNDLFLLLEECN